MTTFHKKLWLGLAVMAVLSPLGIYLPEKFGAGDAWGEWGSKTLKNMIGYLPEGFKKLADIWKAPVPDYNFSGEGASFGSQALSYIGSAILGVALVALLLYLISRIVIKHEK
ncbi:MAG TPA: PDGLE domain-containing protein [Dissulfurispiraceae bacterium]|nr:PDGLE domain-containing protein [Dissulfurispiraceae bacterium]